MNPRSGTRPPQLAVAALLLTALLAPASRASGDADWKVLDAEVASLATELDSAGPQLEFAAYIKSSYRRSNDLVYTFDPVTFAPLGDYGGFTTDSMGLSLKGQLEEFSFKFGYNPSVDKLRSTYVRWQVTDAARLTMGKFKVPLLRSRLVRTTRLLFLDRSIQARATGPRELGLKGEFDLNDALSLKVAVQDGTDGTLSEKRWTARLEARLLGGGLSKYEGAYRAKDLWRSSLGIGISDDGAFGDGRVLAADLGVTRSRFSLGLEWLDHGDDLGSYKRGLIDPATILQRGGTQPYGISISWMLVDKKLEAAARLQAFDDPHHTEMTTLGLNHYMHGHHAKVQLNWIDVSSDIPGLESNVIALGVVLDA